MEPHSEYFTWSLIEPRQYFTGLSNIHVFSYILFHLNLCGISADGQSNNDSDDHHIKLHSVFLHMITNVMHFLRILRLPCKES